MCKKGKYKNIFFFIEILKLAFKIFKRHKFLGFQVRYLSPNETQLNVGQNLLALYKLGCVCLHEIKIKRSRNNPIFTTFCICLAKK